MANPTPRLKIIYKLMVVVKAANPKLQKFFSACKHFSRAHGIGDNSIWCELLTVLNVWNCFAGVDIPEDPQEREAAHETFAARWALLDSYVDDQALALGCYEVVAAIRKYAQVLLETGFAYVIETTDGDKLVTFSTLAGMDEDPEVVAGSFRRGEARSRIWSSRHSRS